MDSDDCSDDQEFSEKSARRHFTTHKDHNRAASTSTSKTANPHIFKALCNLDGDSDVPEEELEAVTAFIHQQISGLQPRL